MKDHVNKIVGGIAISLGIAMIMACIIFGSHANNEIDTKAVGSQMMDYASKMSTISSISGDSVAESYYNDHGQYLMGEAKSWNALMRFNLYQTIIEAWIGSSAGVALSYLES